MERLVTSWDDYSEYNVKLAALLKKYDIPAIFYIEVDPHREGTKEAAKKQIRRLHDQGFEIGCHSWSHPKDIKRVSPERLHQEIVESKYYIEHIIEKEVESFCYPRGRRNEEVMDKVKEAGFRWARTTAIGDCEDISKPLELNTTCHVYDRKEYDGLSWLDWAKQEWDKGGMFHLWGHSWEIQENDQWNNLIRFFKYINETK